MAHLAKRETEDVKRNKVSRKLVRLRVKDVIPYGSNARHHTDEQIEAICHSFKKHGFVAPILVDEDNTIIAGHGRYLAAKKLKLKKIPAIRIAGLTNAQKRTYRIADNKLALMSSWDKKALKTELEQLMVLDTLEIEDTGFSTAEIDLVFDSSLEDRSEEELKALEDLPNIPPVTRSGDIWILGKHRIICGSALRKATYELLMQDELADQIISDPPYNVGISGHVCGSGKIKHAEFSMASGEMSQQEFTKFLNRAFRRMARFSKDNATAFYFMDWRHIREITDAAYPVYGPHKQLCVWVKDNGGMGSFYRSRHELVFVFLKQGQKGINNFKLGQHGRYRTNVWEYAGINTFSGKNYELLKLHPTVKPVSMIADILRDCSRRNGIVLDAFSGSGTIILAAERTGRRARAIEYEPKYVDVTLQRWIQETGIAPILEKTGETFDQVMKRRQRKQGGKDNV